MEDYPYLAEAIAEVLERKRQDANINRTKLADFSGIDRRHLFAICQGKIRPTVNVIFFLCRSLGISPTDFFREVEEEIRKRVKANNSP